MSTKNFTQVRPLHVIAREIINVMRKETFKNGNSYQKKYYASLPYLNAMNALETIDDSYMFDSGKSIVLRALCNLTVFKGEYARAVKKELKKIAGIK